MTIEHKQGDTFLANCTYQDAGGVAQSLAGITVTSQIRSMYGQLIADLDYTAGVGTGAFSLRADNTDDWPVGKVHWDVQFVSGGDIFSTQTADITVVSDVTSN